VPRPTTSFNRRFHGRARGYRSGLEEALAQQLRALGVEPKYESEKIEYTDPKVHKYTPDFKLPNGIIIESKGYFTTADRRKHLLVQEQHPELDVRFIFTRAASRLSKKSSTTYAAWCDKHGFKYAERHIPAQWLQEKPK
jgi:hypothetical protein